MDSSSLHEAQKEDGKVIQQIKNQETEDETEEEIKQQTDIITYMGYELYWAAERGKINDAILERRDNLESLLTPNKNTILHIYITSTSSEDLEPTEFVRQVLTMCPELLMQPNAKKETPLHIAARYGHASIVELLIQHAKALHPQNLERGVEEARQMMRMPNQNQDTALHEAARFQHLSVVKIWIREDCDFVYSANEEGETPFYMAAERGYSDIVFEILEKCKSPATGGPDGRNVLHAATIRKDREMIERILGKMGALTLKEADKMGWTPLHHAANMGYFPAVKLFIESTIGREAAYMKDTQGNTALHLAVALNHETTMREIIKWCRECCELVNNKGWNIIHSAVQSRFPSRSAIDTILEKSAFSNLLNEKDDEGNAPLHHTAISLNTSRLGHLVTHPRVDKMAFNKHNKNALDLASSAKGFLQWQKADCKRRLKNKGVRLGIRMCTPITDEEDEEKNEKYVSSMTNRFGNAANASLIVATLIATVTFTAGFTVPGGFYNEKGTLQGTPLLGNKKAFKAFIIMNTIAMIFSSSAVFVHLFYESWFITYYSTAFSFTFVAMAAMVGAFVTGTYAMLGYSKALSIATCVLVLPFLILLYLFYLRERCKFAVTRARQYIKRVV